MGIITCVPVAICQMNMIQTMDLPDLTQTHPQGISLVAILIWITIGITDKLSFKEYALYIILNCNVILYKMFKAFGISPFSEEVPTRAESEKTNAFGFFVGATVLENKGKGIKHLIFKFLYTRSLI